MAINPPLPLLLPPETDSEYVTALWHKVRTHYSSSSDLEISYPEMEDDQKSFHGPQRYGIDILKYGGVGIFSANQR